MKAPNPNGRAAPSARSARRLRHAPLWGAGARRRRAVAVLAATSFALATSLSAAATLPLTAVEQADAVLKPFAGAGPGLSVLVARRGEAIYARAIGAADIEHAAPVAPGTRFLIGSVSKEFVAFAVEKLAHEGKVDLEADVRTYVPELPDYGEKITVLDLIHHTSGLRDQVELMALDGTPIEGLVTQSAALAVIFNQTGVNFPAGTDFRYANSNYTLLAEIVRRRAGKTLREYLASEVFAPLGMTDTYLSDVATEVVSARATGYSPTPTGFRRALLNYGIFGSSGIWSTPRDLLKWSRELMAPKVFDPALVAAAKTPGHLADGSPLTYAAGLVVSPFAGLDAVYHAGADPGFQSILVSFPKDQATIAVLSNGDGDASGVAEKLAEIFLGGAPKIPTAGIKPDPSALQRLAGLYVNGWDPAISVEAAGDGGVVKMGGAHIPLGVSSDGSFYVRTPRNRFVQRGDGAMVVQSSLSGTLTIYRKVSPWNPNAETLKTLAGRYRSADIDTTFTLIPSATGVELQSLRDPPVPLVPADRDALQSDDARYPTYRLTFIRDGVGRISAFALATGRTRGLVFVRQP